VPPYFSQSTFLRHAREGSLELCTTFKICKDSTTIRQGALPPESRDHPPDVQVDRSLKRKAVMRLQLDLGGCRAGTRLRRQIVWAALIIDIICGLLCCRFRWQQQWRCGGRGGDRWGYGGGARKGGAIYDCAVVIHEGGTRVVRRSWWEKKGRWIIKDDGDGSTGGPVCYLL
jgi:hypothetical protein